MNLYEFEGKALLARMGVPTPAGVFAVDSADAQAAGEAIGFPCVVKSQVLTGGRGKAGGIAIVQTAEELREAAERILDLTIKGETPVGLLIEDRVPEGRELYAAVVFDSSRACPALLFSATGGVEVESNAANLLRVPVPVGQLSDVTPAWVATALTAAALDLTPAGDLLAPLGDDGLAAVSRLLANLLTVFAEHDLELLEINPLVLTADGLVAADAKITVDDDALFRQHDTVALVARAPLAELEARAREHGLNFVDLEGEVCVMGNGAGLCLSLLDAMAAHGSSAANFLDTGGGASTTKAYEGMRILQDRSQADPGVRARLVMLSLAITRAKEAADGIVQSHRERPDGVPTFAVVHGTGSEEGRRILEEAGIHVAPDIRTAVELAATAERSA